MIAAALRALGLALTALPLLASAPARAQPTYHFSPVNQYGVTTTAAYWNPIIRYVSDASGVKLELKIGRTSADTIAYVLAKEVEFSFNNHMFDPDREKLGWKVFGRRKAAPVHGQIVVAEDSPYTKLSQLAGQVVAFPGPEATVAYKFTYAQLLSQGVDVTVAFGGNHDGSFSQMFSGKAAAAGANSQLVSGYTHRTGKKFRVLWTSEPAYELALMASPAVPAKDAKAVERAFLAMATDPRGMEVIRSVSALVGLPPDSHFVASDGSEYGVYRRFYQAAPARLR